MDSKTRKNYFFNLSYQILAIIAPLVTTPYVSRVLQSEGVGEYSYTFTIATAFSLFAALGVNSYGQREIAYRQNDDYGRSKVFWELLAVRSIMTFVILGIYLAFSFAYQQYTPLLLAQAFIVLGVLPDISWFFQGMEDFGVVVLRNLVVRVATIVLIFLFVRTSDDVIIYILINSFSIFFGNCLFFFGLGRHVCKVPRKDLDLLQHVPGVIQFFIPLIAVQLYSQLDKIMLGSMMDNANQSGYYEQARKVAQLAVTMIVSLNTVLYSRNAHLFATGQTDDVRQSMRDGLIVMCMIMLPIVFGLFLATDNLVQWFFGPGFEPVGPLLKVSCPMIVCMCIGNFAGMQFLAPTGRQNQMTAAYVIASCVNIAMNFVLIPRFQSMGALVSSLAAELCSCLIQVWLLVRSEYRFPVLRQLIPYLCASIVMSAGLVAWQGFTSIQGPLETLAEFLLGALLYAIVLVCWKGTYLNRLAVHLRER